MDEYKTLFENMPTRVRAVTVQDEYGEKCVIVNCRLNDIMQKKAHIHELNHISNDDFSSEHSVEYIEKYNH